MTIKEFQNLTDDEKQAVLMAMKPGHGASANEQARFEMFRRIALGHELTEEEKAGIEAGTLYNSLKHPGKGGTR